MMASRIWCARQTTDLVSSRRHPKKLTAGPCSCGTFRTGEAEGRGALQPCRCGTSRTGEAHGHRPIWAGEWEGRGAPPPCRSDLGCALDPCRCGTSRTGEGEGRGAPPACRSGCSTHHLRKLTRALPVWNVPHWRSGGAPHLCTGESEGNGAPQACWHSHCLMLTTDCRHPIAMAGLHHTLIYCRSLLILATHLPADCSITLLFC